MRTAQDGSDLDRGAIAMRTSGSAETWRHEEAQQRPEYLKEEEDSHVIPRKRKEDIDDKATQP